MVFVWNDASADPLGDIWYQAARSVSGRSAGPTGSPTSEAPHFVPAVSERNSGAICIPRWGPGSPVNTGSALALVGSRDRPPVDRSPTEP